jgi:hypothetical protein
MTNSHFTTIHIIPDFTHLIRHLKVLRKKLLDRVNNMFVEERKGFKEKITGQGK